MLCPICDCHACLHNDLPDEEFERLLNAKQRASAINKIWDSASMRIDPSYIWAPYVPILKTPEIDMVAIKHHKSLPKMSEKYIWNLEYDIKKEAIPAKTIPKYSYDDLKKLFTALVGVGVSNIDLGDLTEEEIDEYIKQIKDQYNGDVVGYSSVTRSTDTTAPPVTLVPTQEELRTQRKRDGLCLDCGDRGEFINGACVCRNGHGKIFG